MTQDEKKARADAALQNWLDDCAQAFPRQSIMKLAETAAANKRDGGKSGCQAVFENMTQRGNAIVMTEFTGR